MHTTQKCEDLLGVTHGTVAPSTVMQTSNKADLVPGLTWDFEHAWGCVRAIQSSSRQSHAGGTWEGTAK